MAISEAKKRADAKWHKANTKTAACSLSVKEYDAFKAYTEQYGRTVSGSLLQYIRCCINGTPLSQDDLLKMVDAVDNLEDLIQILDLVNSKLRKYELDKSRPTDENL